MLLTLVVCLPHLDDDAQSGLAARGEHMLRYICPFPSDVIDTLSRTVDVAKHERQRLS